MERDAPRLDAATLALLGVAPPPDDAAARLPGHREGDLLLRDLRLTDGGSLPEARLHYTTLGTPRRDGAGRVSNAALLLHGTTGTGRSWLAPTLAGELFGPGQPLDLARWYLILPDGLGRGGSSKPSDGLRGRFPRYGYGDVVAGHHRVVAEGLGVDRLRLVLGSSMGGMHAWLWAERWPDQVDAVMPIACLPVQISGRNLLWRRILAEAIRADPGWNGGDYRDQPRAWRLALPIFLMMASSAAQLQGRAPTRRAAEALFDGVVKAAAALDAADTLYWWESSFDYDPEPELGRIRARLLAVNFADDALTPPELGILERLAPRVPGGAFVTVPAGPLGAGHRTLALAAVWKGHLESLLRDLPDPP